MAANMGLSPEIMDTEAFPPDKGGDGSVSGASLMERLRGRCSQLRSWADTIKVARLFQINDKRIPSVPMEKSSLQSCLDTLHKAMKITSHQSLIERLDLISRQLGIFFTPPTMSDSHVTLSTDMFKVVVVLDGHSGIKDVRVGHSDTGHSPMPSSCEELFEVLSNGNFDEFVRHLQGLISIYNITGDKKQKMKCYLALSSLETDLNTLAQLQSSINGVANYIHKSPLGILLPRRGGFPMKLIYYVSPYDLLCKKTKSSHTMTVEAITEHDLGHSVTVCLEQSSANNKLQTMPLNSVKSNMDGKSLPSFQGVNNINSYTLPASFVLNLSQPVPVAKSVLNAIQAITGLEPVHDEEKPFLSVLINDCAGDIQTDKREFFVTLPDQQHVYYLNCASDGVLSGTGCLLRKIPFTHPTSVPNVLNLLRQQLVFNSVLQSIVRPQARHDYTEAVVYEVTAESLHYLSIMFEHPLHNSMFTVEFNLSDITNVKCKVCTDSETDSPFTDDAISKAFQRCFSIPVTLRSVIKRIQGEIQQVVTPEPVKIPYSKIVWTFSAPPPPRHQPIKVLPDPPVSVSSISPLSNTNIMNSVSPSSSTSLGTVSLPNPPPYPGIADSWTAQTSQSNQQHIQDIPKFPAMSGMTGFGRSFVNESLQQRATSTPPVTSHGLTETTVPPPEQRPAANPLLATLLDAGSPVVVSSPQPPPSANVVNESPMLSKLLEDTTSVATNPFPAPNPRKRLTKRKSSKDMLAGKSPKHRVSDSDITDRTSEHVNSGRHGQGMGEKHIDLDSSAGSYDEPLRPSSVNSVGSIGGQSTSSMIDLTDTIEESHVKKLENSLDSIMGKESPHSSNFMGMNSQFVDSLDINFGFPDFTPHHNQNLGTPSMLGDPSGEFQPPWPSRQTPPTSTSRNSPHHGVVPKNEKTSTSHEDLLHGPRGRENEGPLHTVNARRTSQQQRRQSFKRQNSTGRNSVESSSGGVSPSFDVFSPLITSPSHNLLASPTALQLSSPLSSVSPSSLTMISPSQPSNSISPGLTPTPGAAGKTTDSNVNHDTKSGVLGSHLATTTVTTSHTKTGVGHITSLGKPSMSFLKAQLEMDDSVKYNSAIAQDCVSVKEELSNQSSASSASSQPPVMKLKLTNMRQFDNVSPSDGEDCKSRSSTFDFHSDEEDDFILPKIDHMTVVSASPTRLQISNKQKLERFNKYNKTEKFKRRCEKELKQALSVDSGKRKRDKDESKKDKKRQKKVNSVDKEIAVYKSTTVDIGAGNENDHTKRMPKLKIIKSGDKISVENSVLQSKDIKTLDKNNEKLHVKSSVKDDKAVVKLEKEAVVKIEKVEKAEKAVSKLNNVSEFKSEKRKEKPTSTEGIFERINAMKTEALKSDDSNSSVDRKMDKDTSSASQKKVKKLHKRSSSGTKSEAKVSKTPTIKLAPIKLPMSTASSVTVSRNPSTPSTPLTPKSITQSPTSTTIGKIGAVSLATSGLQKQLPTNPAGKSPQGSGSSGKISSRTLSTGSQAITSKMNSNLQKNYQIQGPSGKNSPVPTSKSGSSRSSSTSVLNSSSGSAKSDKSLSKSLNSGGRTSSPSIEKEKSSKSSSSNSRSSSSSRDRDKSTSSNKASTPVTSVNTQDVLSFLNQKRDIMNFTIPKLQKASTPTSVNSPTIVSTCTTTTVTTTSTNSSVKFSKGTSQSVTQTSKANSGTNLSSAKSNHNSNSAKNSFSKGGSGSFQGNSGNSRPTNLNMSNTLNSNRQGGNNSPSSFAKGSNSYKSNAGSQGSSGGQFRNSNNASGQNKTLANSSNQSAHSNWNSNSGGSKPSNHSSTQNQTYRGTNATNSANFNGNSKQGNSISNSEITNSGNRQVSSGSNVTSTNFTNKGTNMPPNGPKGPGPPGSTVPLDSKRQGSGGQGQAAVRGRKGSLSAVIDKLTCKASGPSVSNVHSNPILSNSSSNSLVTKKSEQIVNESPASPEMDAPVLEPVKLENKVVIEEAPASPEPDTPASPVTHTLASRSEIVSIPLEKPSQLNDLDYYNCRTSQNSDELPALRTSPKTIPLNSPPKDKLRPKTPNSDSSKNVANSKPVTTTPISQQNGTIDSYYNSSVGSKQSENSKQDLVKVSRAKEKSGALKVPKRQGSMEKEKTVNENEGDNCKMMKTEAKVDKVIDSSPPSSPENGLIIDIAPSLTHPSKTTCSPSLQHTDSSDSLEHHSPFNCISKSPSIKSSSPSATALANKLQSKPQQCIVSVSLNSPSNDQLNSAGSNPSSPIVDDDYDLMDEALCLGN